MEKARRHPGRLSFLFCTFWPRTWHQLRFGTMLLKPWSLLGAFLRSEPTSAHMLSPYTLSAWYPLEHPSTWLRALPRSSFGLPQICNLVFFFFEDENWGCLLNWLSFHHGPFSFPLPALSVPLPCTRAVSYSIGAAPVPLTTSMTI